MRVNRRLGQTDAGQRGAWNNSRVVDSGGGRGGEPNNKSPTDAHLFFMLEIVLTQVNHPQIIDTLSAFWTTNRTSRAWPELTVPSVQRLSREGWLPDLAASVLHRAL